MSDHALRILYKECDESGNYAPYMRQLERMLGINNSKEPDFPILDTRSITEEDKEEIIWYKKARKVDSVDEFIIELLSYNHDYGTIVNAMVAAAIAACSKVDHDPLQGGITGFQASCVMWGFLHHWMHKKGAMRLLEYSNMLYPQYSHLFETKLSIEIWIWMQKEAAKNLLQDYGSTSVRKHWQSIIDGVIPFGWSIKEEKTNE